MSAILNATPAELNWFRTLSREDRVLFMSSFFRYQLIPEESIMLAIDHPDDPLKVEEIHAHLDGEHVLKSLYEDRLESLYIHLVHVPDMLVHEWDHPTLKELRFCFTKEGNPIFPIRQDHTPILLPDCENPGQFLRTFFKHAFENQESKDFRPPAAYKWVERLEEDKEPMIVQKRKKKSRIQKLFGRIRQFFSSFRSSRSSTLLDDPFDDDPFDLK